MPTSTYTPTLTPSAPDPHVIQGYIWIDYNGDGIRQPEEGLSGVQAVLMRTPNLASVSPTQQWEVTTDAEGYYRFENVEPAPYELSFNDLQDRIPVTIIDIDGGDLDVVGMDIEIVYIQLYLSLVFRD